MLTCDRCKKKTKWVVTAEYDEKTGKGDEHFVCDTHLKKYFVREPNHLGRMSYVPKQERMGMQRFRPHRWV